MSRKGSRLSKKKKSTRKRMKRDDTRLLRKGVAKTTTAVFPAVGVGLGFEVGKVGAGSLPAFGSATAGLL